MTGIILVLTTGIIWNFVGIIFGGLDREQGKVYGFFLINAVIFSLFSLAFAILTGHPGPVRFSDLLILAGMIAPVGLLSMLNFYSLKRAMEYGPQSIAWSVVQFSFTLSYAVAVLFLGCRCSPVNVCGIGLMCLSIGLFVYSMNRKSQKSSDFRKPAFFKYAACAFLGTGFAHVLYMLPNQPFFGLSQEVMAFRLPLLAVPQLLWIVPVLKTHVPLKDFRAVCKRAVLYSLTVCAGQVCYFQAIDALNRTGRIGLASPLAIGSCVLFFFLYRVVSRKESADFAMSCGLVSGIAGLFLMSA